MNEDRLKRTRALNALERALDDWTRRGNEQPLTRWLERELDRHGAPIDLPISDWRGCLRSMLRATSIAGELPSQWTGPVTRLIQATRWFSRRDGHPVMDFEQSLPGHFTDATEPGDVNDSNGPEVERIVKQLLAKTSSGDGDDARVDWGDRSVCWMCFGLAGPPETTSWPSIIETWNHLAMSSSAGLAGRGSDPGGRSMSASPPRRSRDRSRGFRIPRGSWRNGRIARATPKSQHRRGWQASTRLLYCRFSSKIARPPINQFAR